MTKAHPELEKHADAISDQVGPAALDRPGASCASTAARSWSASSTRSGSPQAVSDIFGQVLDDLARLTRIFEDQGVEPLGQERYIADTFCARAAARVDSSLDQIESNDDERMTAIAKLAYKRGEYGYALFED